ncbi:MAG: DegV family protein [Eubacteriales bacterium]|jgi:DegV family protein with EDD domain
MREFIIATDATCDLPCDLVREMGILVLPMEFQMSGTSYRHYFDAREMSLEEFYRRTGEGEMTTTSQINMTTYEEYFVPVLEEGKDILYICFSSGLSGTYQASRIAAAELQEKFPDRKIISIDSLCASSGEGLLVWAAVQQKKQGMELEQLAQWVEDHKMNVCHWYTVDDLQHLKRGGRISAATAMVGGLLNVKPVLRVDDEGRLVSYGKARGRRKSMESMVEQAAAHLVNPEEQTIFVGHGGCKEEGEMLYRLAQERLHVKNIIFTEVGPVIGAHTGVGVLTLFHFGDHR